MADAKGEAMEPVANMLIGNLCLANRPEKPTRVAVLWLKQFECGLGHKPNLVMTMQTFMSVVFLKKGPS